ncbi:AsmA family protein [Mucilaginibacter sp. KACC 22063]|uniref:AsmA family protein n=1 Tax=Mucilaginibacter sp. KACC 22063 TaxID=3025666 RepID=UPI0023661221|nr:AsmA-like C-terminal region-containing protein [Mucilaginibacter sp. KACC 22063]WDF55054.1 AsmA-like C-terminal region-containing protein [Mucilaginibacter sp. KACC 22063]
MPKWLKILLKVLAGVILFVLLLLTGLGIYINTHKAKVIALINQKLNSSLDGKVEIGDMSASFFKNFPHASLSLSNVVIRDKRWAEHKHTLLDAKDFDVAVNTGPLLSGTISIDHIDINNAAIDIYSDSTGYSNTSIFKKKNKKENKTDKSGSSADAELSRFNLNNVSLTINNQQANKLYKFDVDQLNGKMDFPDSGWVGNVHLKVRSRSLAFKTSNGSFIKDKLIEGDLKAGYNEGKDIINVHSDNLSIGGDVFKLNALFTPAPKSRNFKFHLIADQILWKDAASLVSNNISKTLYKFNLEKPISIDATISGNFGGGDPLLYITTVVKNNKLNAPGIVIDNCSFNGLFTNEYLKGKGLTDENSIINFYKFTGTYKHVPFTTDTASVINLTTPIIRGNFRAKFPLSDMNYMMPQVAKFSAGNADINMRFKADVVNLQINKPFIAGHINFNNADINYVPSGLNFRNSSVAISIENGNLAIDNLRLQSGHSIVTMQGKAENLMNLYYDAPEKIVINWYINSPQIHIAEFLGYLNNHASRKSAGGRSSRTANSRDLIDQLSTVLNKSQADFHMRVAKVYYKKFVATNAVMDVNLSEDGIEIKDFNVKHAGGSLAIRGRILQDNTSNRFNITSVVTRANIQQFFYQFNNFGLTGPTYQNLRGYLSAKAQISGTLTSAGDLVPRSLNGKVLLNLTDGALLNFNPLKTVGKIAFPFRDLNNIQIPKLDAQFDINGEKITIHPMQITSSVINADVAGIYSLGRGTDISLDVPLRNPKKDTSITDKAELEKKRYKGIVLHLKAKDDGTGKVKIGLK